MYKEDRVLSNPRGSRISRLNMSRALGDGNFKSPQRLVEATPDVVRVALRPHRDQFFILARWGGDCAAGLGGAFLWCCDGGPGLTGIQNQAEWVEDSRARIPAQPIEAHEEAIAVPYI